MGVISRESTLTSLASYAGAAIGFVNKFILFTAIFTAEQVGLANLMISIAVLFSQVSLLGYPSVLLKYFPRFKDRDQNHHGILWLGVLLCTAGFLIVLAVFVVFRSQIMGYYAVKSPLINEYYWSVVAISGFFLMYNLFSVYLRSLFKTFVPVLIFEVVMRVLTSAAIALYVMDAITFGTFIWLYVMIHCSSGLMVMIYTAWLRQLHIRPRMSAAFKTQMPQMLSLTLLAWAGNMATYVVLNLDQIMIAGMLGLSSTGIYSTMVYLATLMMIPGRALMGLSVARVAEYFEANDMKQVDRFYKRTATLNYVIGQFLFIGILVNVTALFHFLPPEYEAGKWVLLWLCVARLFDLVTGLNGVIMLASKWYRWDVLFMGGMVAATWLANQWLIEKWGIEGAALATMAVIMSFNLFRVLFLYALMGVQPFHPSLLPAALIGGVTFAAAWFLPEMPNAWLDLAMRSAVVGIVYPVLVLRSGLSPDLNEYVSKQWRRLRGS